VISNWQLWCEPIVTDVLEALDCPAHVRVSLVAAVVIRCHELGPWSGTSTTSKEASSFPLSTPFNSTRAGRAALKGTVVGVAATKLLTTNAGVVVSEGRDTGGRAEAVVVVDGAGVDIDDVVVGAIRTSVGTEVGRRFGDDVSVKTNTTSRIGLDHITRWDVLRELNRCMRLEG